MTVKLSKTNILLVGYGRMGRALFKSWENLTEFNVSVVSPHCPQKTNFFSHLDELPDNYHADIIVLCIKPQVMAEVLPAYAKMTSDKTLIISIAAGFPLIKLQHMLAGKVVRAMPNLAVSIGRGVIGLYADSLLEGEKVLVNSVFNKAGKIFWVDSEELINAITAISGSGPAYFYYFTESLGKAGEEFGFPPDIALELAEQTFMGAAEVLSLSPGRSVQDLRNQVTSPNGTTASGIKSLEQMELVKSITLAVRAAFNRAQELSK